MLLLFIILITAAAAMAIAALGSALLIWRGPGYHIRSLAGKHVLITGGSSGIGFSLAKRCLAEGAFVTLVGRTHSRLLQARDSLVRAMAVPPAHILIKAGDVSDASSIAKVVKESFDWRPIDVLVCNAGTLSVGQIENVSVEDLEHTTKTNLLGCVYTLHAALPLMKSRSFQNPSSILIMGSMASLAFMNEANIYSATKFALKGLTDYLRIELLPYRIPVSLACPGFTTTPMLKKVDKATESSELIKKVSLYDKDHAESPDNVANQTIEGVKRGDLLITTSHNAFMLGVLSRGCIPPTSITRALIELLLLVPMRIYSFVWFHQVKGILKLQLEENLKLHSNSKLNSTN